MTITTTLDQHIAIAHRYEAEKRWAAAAEAYGAAIATFRHPTDTQIQGDIAHLEGLRRSAIMRSHEMVSTVATPASEDAKAAVDKQQQDRASLMPAAQSGALASQQQDEPQP